MRQITCFQSCNYICVGEIKFYVVFLLVNNYPGDVVVSTGLSGTSESVRMGSGQTVVVSEQPNNANPITLTAKDSATDGEVSINEQSSISITPDEVFGASFQVLFLHRKDPSKCRIFHSTLFCRS